MDHAISSLKEFLSAEMEMYHEGYSTREAVAAYIKAIGELEKHYYGEVKTDTEIVLA